MLHALDPRGDPSGADGGGSSHRDTPPPVPPPPPPDLGGMGSAAVAADVAHRVAHVLSLCAKRLELRHQAEQFVEAERRKSVQTFTGKSIEEIAALTMQRSSRAFLHGLKRRQHEARRRQLDVI